MISPTIEGEVEVVTIIEVKEVQMEGNLLSLVLSINSHRINQALMVLGLKGLLVKSVANLVTKQLIATIEWIMLIKESTTNKVCCNGHSF